jgi:hypothetical protein
MPVLLCAYRDAVTVFRWFTSNAKVIVRCHAIRGFRLGIYALHMGVLTGLGLQWTLGVVTLVCLWILDCLPPCILVFPNTTIWRLYAALDVGQHCAHGNLCVERLEGD